MYELSKEISEYKMCKIPDNIDYHTVGTTDLGCTVVEIIDCVADYTELMKGVFDFPLLKGLISDPSFKTRIDCFNGVTGPFGKAIFIDELGATPESVVHSTPLPDFGGLHPDPNLTYAKDLVEEMGKGTYDFGCAYDGDGVSI
eukprot:Awhi_evm1s7945